MKVWDVLKTKFSDKNSSNKSFDNFVGDEDEQMEIYYYNKAWIKTIVTYISIGLSCFILKLIFYWKPVYWLYCTHNKCTSSQAHYVLLYDKYDQIFIEKVISLDTEQYVVPKSNGAFESTNSLRYFVNKKIRYLWSQQNVKFEKLYGLDRDILCSSFAQSDGLKDEQQFQRTILYGQNEIEIKVQSLFEILMQEVLSPFYIFQFAAIVLWCLDEYYYYGSFIMAMSIGSLLSSTLQIRRNQQRLRKTVGGDALVEVWKGGDNYQTQASNHLVPGDVIVLPSSGLEMVCDVVLLNGNAIADESMLTGESVPVIKSAIPSSNTDFSRIHHFKHIIFSGTKVIQTRYYGTEKVKAMVIRTSFQTAKGELVRSILFPKPVDFKFNRHIIQFIIIMLSIAVSGFVYTFVIKIKRGDSIGNVIIKALDLITIAVPPELPASLTIANIFVDQRLRAQQIYCMSPKSINMSGCVDCIVFDKTGTLTEDELSLAEVLPTNLKSNQFAQPITCIDKQELSPLLVCMASCHSLTILDNNIIGDPLDIKMFESTKWVLEEPEVNDSNKFDLLAPTIVRPSTVSGIEKPQVGILRQFLFSSNLSRMSVITRQLGQNGFEVYVKGAPEVIATLCEPNTVPKDFDRKLNEYTEKSYRVLAVAYRSLDQMNYKNMQRAQREDLETGLTFLGLVVMKNNLKDQTVETIDTLNNANIRTLMATGDNLMTALSVAQECHLIRKNDSVIIIDSYTDSEGKPRLECKYKEMNGDINEFSNEKCVKSVNIDVDKRSHLAVTGTTFKVIQDYYSDLLPKLIVCGTVFARMSPENKQQLIECLQKCGYVVSMTGDGANDVGALKASNCGISLADTEASVAAPFTSKAQNISCVTVLLREGRAALVSVFGVIKYMACYNITSFIAVLILYSFRSNITDIQNLYQDLVLITLFVILFARNDAYGKLSPLKPPTSLISLTQLTSILSHILLVLIFQMAAVLLIWRQTWFKEHHPEKELDYQSHINFAVFTVQVFQYITLAIVFSKGSPYRKPFYTNRLFLIAIIVTTCLTVWVCVAPERPKIFHNWIAHFFEIEFKGFTYEFRGILVGLTLVHFVLAVILEEFIIGKLIAEKLVGLTKDTKYKKIQKQCHDRDWISSM